MKPRVLQLIPSFHTGGSERQAVQLVRLLQEAGGCEIFVACLDAGGVLRPEIEKLGFADIPEFALTSFYDRNMIRQIRKFARFLRENRIEIVQAHDFYTNVFGMLGAFLAGVPVRIAAKRETGTKTKAQAFAERRAYNLATAIVANAEAVKKHLVACGVPARKIRVVYNGLDLARLAPKETSRGKILGEFGLPAGENLRFVTILANLRSEVKNHRMFLRAARLIKTEFPDARFVLAGEGDLLGEMKRFAAETGLAEDAFFLGRCSAPGELLSVSHVGVLSSVTEGFSNSIIEYMAAALPVVATNVGGAGEAVAEDETGFLVESGDERALANRVLELLRNPEKARRFGSRGRQTAEEKFSLRAQVEKIHALYDELASEKRVSAKRLNSERTAV